MTADVPWSIWRFVGLVFWLHIRKSDASSSCVSWRTTPLSPEFSIRLRHKQRAGGHTRSTVGFMVAMMSSSKQRENNECGKDANQEPELRRASSWAWHRIQRIILLRGHPGLGSPASTVPFRRDFGHTDARAIAKASMHTPHSLLSIGC